MNLQTLAIDFCSELSGLVEFKKNWEV